MSFRLAARGIRQFHSSATRLGGGGGGTPGAKYNSLGHKYPLDISKRQAFWGVTSVLVGGVAATQAIIEIGLWRGGFIREIYGGSGGTVR